MAQNFELDTSIHEKMACIETTLLAVLSEMRQAVPRQLNAVSCLEGLTKRDKAIEHAF